MDGQFVVPAPASSGTWHELESVSLELARKSQGRLFEKHILSKGTLIHPKTGQKINVDDAFMGGMIRNFRENVCDIVQVPLANEKNEHDENADRNKGEVIDVRARDGKLYAVIDAREDPDKFGKTYLGASAFLSTNYVDSRTGKLAGPTLLHVAVTNRPYVVGLEPYKEIAALSAAEDGEVVVLTPEEQPAPGVALASDNEVNETTVLTQQEEPHVPTKEELLAQLKDEHGIDVEALQASATPAVDSVALSEAVSQALAANPTLAALAAGNPDGLTVTDLAGAVVELSRQNTVISEGYQELRKERAAESVDKLIGTGHILPKQRDFAIDLKLSGSQEKWDAFVPDAPVIPVGVQAGFSAQDDTRQQQDQQAEVDRLTTVYTDHIASGRKQRVGR